MTSKRPTLGASVELDVDALLASRMLLCANSGGGKSWAIRRLLEQTHGKCQQIILDPDGEFSSLRELHDYLVAGAGGDCPADLVSVELLARRVRETRVSVIVDISELRGEDKPEFVARFLNALYEVPREQWHPAIVVVDEVHRFCPERGRARKKNERKAIEESSAAVVLLMDSARKRGLSGVLATQRISKVSKDATGECNNKLIGRSLELDAKRAGEELGMSGRESIANLRRLDPGEFYAFGPAISRDVVTVKIGAIRTTHPRPGQPLPPVPAPSAAMRKIIAAHFSDLPAAAAAEAKTVDELRAKVRGLEAELRTARKATPPPTPAPKLVERPVLGDKQLDRVEKFIKRGLEITGALGVELAKLGTAIAPLSSVPLYSRLPARPAASPAPAPRPAPSPDPTPTSVSARVDRAVASGALPGSSALVPAQQKMLDTMALLERLGVEASRDTFCAWYGAHPRSKGLQNNLGTLRSAGLVAEFALTDEGRRRANYIDPPTQEQARDLILRKLKPGQRRILELALEHPGTDRERFGELLGKHPRTKSVANNIGALRSRGLLSEDWPLQPSRVLYLNGAN